MDSTKIMINSEERLCFFLCVFFDELYEGMQIGIEKRETQFLSLDIMKSLLLLVASTQFWLHQVKQASLTDSQSLFKLLLYVERFVDRERKICLIIEVNDK